MSKYAIRLLKNKFYPLVTPDNLELEEGELVVYQDELGEDVGKVFRVCPKIQEIWDKTETEKLTFIRQLTTNDKARLAEQKIMEEEGFKSCRQAVGQHNLKMNLTQCRYRFDRKKVTFYYTAPERVDFRGLLKDLTQIFRHIRIDLRHIGVRDETSVVQGIGVCGRPYCCCSWIKKFGNVNAKLAKDQGMQLSPSKISGACGRLLCCLNYEYSNYLEMAKNTIPIGSGVMTPDGLGRVFASNLLTEKFSVKLEDGKTKDYNRNDLEMIDGDVNIDIEIPKNQYRLEETPADIKDLKTLEDDRNSSTGNV